MPASRTTWRHSRGRHPERVHTAAARALAAGDPATLIRIELFDRGHRLAGHPGEGGDLLFEGHRLSRVGTVLPGYPVRDARPRLAAYFFLKAAFYVWMVWTLPMLEALALRSVIGSISLGVLCMGVLRVGRERRRRRSADSGP